MRIIGITGGVGSGKSEVLNYLFKHCNCRIEFADQIAHKLQMPGQPCYDKIISLLGDNITLKDGMIDKKRMAEIIFKDKEKLLKVNQIIHPAVKEYIVEEIAKEKKKNQIEYFFLEAALLIEEGYEKIVDELWYIYADEEVRIARLQKNRGYSKEKAMHIISQQLTDAEFRNHCSFVIDNSNELIDTYYQIDRKLEKESNGK